MSYTIMRHLITTSEPLALAKSRTPEESLREARRIVKESGLDSVTILDDRSGLALGIAAFAANHRLG